MPSTTLRTRAECLAAIVRLHEKLGMPPTVDELREELRVGSTRTAHRYLRRLEDAGDLRRWPGARGMQLLRSAPPAPDWPAGQQSPT